MTSSMPPTTLLDVPVHVLGLALRHLDTLQSLGAAILAHPVLHAAFAEDPARITRDLLDAQMSPATARLAYAAHAARDVDRTSTEAVRNFADAWLSPADPSASSASAPTSTSSSIGVHEGSGPLAIWPWGLSIADVVTMSRTHGVVEHFTQRLVGDALPRCEGVFGSRRQEYGRASEDEVARIHRMLYGYQIYCNLLFRDAEDLRPDLSWRPEVNFQLNASLYPDNVVRANNQLACIHDFLENIVLSAFKQVAMRDVTWGAHQVDYLSTGSANEHVQAYLSLGLDYIFKLDQANTPLPPQASPEAQAQHYQQLRQVLLAHGYASPETTTAPDLPPTASYMLASELNAHSRSHLAKPGAGERRRGLHLWDEPMGPAAQGDEETRRDMVASWAEEAAAYEKKIEETERPAMKALWAEKCSLFHEGRRGIYVDM